MKKSILTAFALMAVSSLSAAPRITFQGSSKQVITVNPDKNTGLNNVYVVYDASQLTSMTISGVSSSAQISKYSNLGGGYAQSVNTTVSGSDIIVENPEGNMGYIIDDSGSSTYIWIVNYLPYKLRLTAASSYTQQDCDNTMITVDGEGSPINYYTIDGRPVELDREIKVSYHNLEWSEDDEQYLQIEDGKSLSHLSETIILTPPLYCNSTVTVSGDRFLKAWNLEEEIESPVIQANGLEVHTKAIQTNLPSVDDPDAPASNMIRTETEGMGGSAPADISFTAFTTDAVLHNEWQIASDPEFEYLLYRFNEQNVDYSFTEEGTFYVRFVGSNADGTCETFGDTYTVTIGASDLRIPNAFTPNGDGVNDEWKVAYRSLLSFKCWIFDRYGTEIFKFEDPTQGWDGKYKGKLVSPGVYFYVIEAQGADGKKYKKGGDINLVRSKRYGESTAGGTTTE